MTDIPCQSWVVSVAVMRADRLVALLLLLQARGKMRATELAAELEVSVRTIYRDLEALGAAGVPVYTDSGPGGGCSILAGYRTSLTGLSPEEATALLALGVSGPAADLGLAGPLADARLKLLAALPAEHRQPGGPRFYLDSPAWFRNPEAAPCLPQLVDAVRHARRVRISHGGHRRTLDPLG